MRWKTQFLCAAMALALATPVSGQLVIGDFTSPGDGLLVTDWATGLEWLTPVYTAGHGFHDPFVASLMGTHGLRRASLDEVTGMIATNFDDPTAEPIPDNVPKVTGLFEVFGAAHTWDCSVTGPCMGMDGYTADAAGLDDKQWVTAARLIGEEWANLSAGHRGLYGSPVTGHWLVREASAPAVVPEPASLLLLGTGLAGLGFMVRRRRDSSSAT